MGDDIDVVDRSVPHLSAHSLKATGLSWSARFGMSWPDRAILGRHQSHTNETVAIYSRDLAVGPVTRFSEMLKAISQGTFCPDAERSKYFPFPPVPTSMPVEEVQDELAVRGPNFGDVEESACKVESSEVQNPLAGGVIILSDSDSTESESGESCIATDSSDNDEPPQKRPRAFQAEKHYREATWFAHKKSGLLHFCWADPVVASGNRRMTACGRMVSANYAAMDESTDGNRLCVICQGRQD